METIVNNDANARIQSRKTTGSDYVVEPLETERYSSTVSSVIGDKKTSKQKQHSSISHRSSLNMTLSTALKEGFRYRSHITVEEEGWYFDPVRVREGYIGSNRKLCSTHIRSKTIPDSLLHASIDFENPECLLMVDSKVFNNPQSLTDRMMETNKELCESMVDVVRYSIRPSFPIKKGDSFMLGKNMMVSIIDVEYKKEKAIFSPKISLQTYYPITKRIRNEFVESPMNFEMKKCEPVPPTGPCSKKKVSFNNNTEVKTPKLAKDSTLIIDPLFDADAMVAEASNLMRSLDISSIHPSMLKSIEISVTNTITKTSKTQIFKELPITIGSSSDCNIVIAAPTILRNHAAIDCVNGNLSFVDLTEQSGANCFLLTRNIEIVRKITPPSLFKVKHI